MSDWVREYYDKIDACDAAGMASYLAERGTFQLGNMPAVQGPEQVADGNQAFFDTIKGLRHDFTHRYTMGAVDIVEADVTYTLHEGDTLTLPGIAVLERGDDNLIAASRSYVDMTPLASRTAEAAARTWVQSFVDAVDTLDVDKVLCFFGDSSTWTYGNNPPMTSLAEMRATMGGFHESIAGISHVLGTCFAPREGVIVAEFEVTYTRLDTSSVTIPASGFYELKDGLIHVYRVYVDVSPVFA
jgi:ketosteroid isomerase-like protein